MIFHIASQAHWDEALASGEYTRSTRELSLEEEGFIHASYREQVLATAHRFYADADEPLVLLSIDEALVGAPVIPEGGTELFPHIYGPLPVSAVVEVAPFAKGADGSFSW